MCNDTFTLLEDYSCDCVEKQIFNETTAKCDDYIECGLGMFNPGDNTCANCTDNCAKCDDVTGAC